jgi:hypothetical protein
MQPLAGCQPRQIEVAYTDNPDPFRIGKIPNEIRPPIAASYNADSETILHIKRPEQSRPFNLKPKMTAFKSSPEVITPHAVPFKAFFKNQEIYFRKIPLLPLQLRASRDESAPYRQLNQIEAGLPPSH